MTRAVLAEDEDDYESACHEHMLLRYIGRAALAEYKDKPIAEARHQHRAARRAIRSSTLNDVANIDVELDELLYAPGGHYRISVASRTIPLQGLRRISSVTASTPKIYTAAASASDPRQCWRAQDQDDTAADLGGWDIQGAVQSCASNVPPRLLAQSKHVRRWLQSGFEGAEAVGMLAERDAKGFTQAAIICSQVLTRNRRIWERYGVRENIQTSKKKKKIRLRGEARSWRRIAEGTGLFISKTAYFSVSKRYIRTATNHKS
ncbi:hypothetical protein B0H14DRAFT_2636491 [Mycena olivaceomarginata]|nr:hypothetical protein B0H14DRAFT_2636491 [Mycena olivaceomarginata]